VVISVVEDAYARERARKHGVPAVYIPPGKFKTKLEPEIEAQYVRVLTEHGVDLVCLAGFMRILGSCLIGEFRGRILNIHPALLPAFPGLEAQRQAWEYGAKVAGCTVHFVDEGIDTGAIIIQRAVPVLDDDDWHTLADRILEQEHKALPLAVQLIAEGRVTVEGRRARIIDSR
jgi:phosphoribosylglycinamide formyltransferase-1